MVTINFRFLVINFIIDFLMDSDLLIPSNINYHMSIVVEESKTKKTSPIKKNGKNKKFIRKRDALSCTYNLDNGVFVLESELILSNAHFKLSQRPVK
jgi:hypothetical protein